MSGILVVAEILDRTLADITAEMIGAASTLRPSLQGPLAVALIGENLEALCAGVDLEGVDEVLMVAAPDNFDAAVCEEAIVALVVDRQPSLILIGHTATGMAVGPAVAARLGTGFATDVLALSLDGEELVATRGAYGGKINMELSFPGKGTVLCLVRGATFPAPATPGNARRIPITLDLAAVDGVGKHLAYQPAPPTGVDLSKAEFVLSIGRGVAEENVRRFAALAERLGAAIGCSRPVADAGWLDKAHQVGQSGTIAASCKLYIAFGISGAVQHLAGMKHVETIIAINTDPDAAIFGIAHYGACIDAVQLAEALEAEFN